MVSVVSLRGVRGWGRQTGTRASLDRRTNCRVLQAVHRLKLSFRVSATASAALDLGCPFSVFALPERSEVKKLRVATRATFWYDATTRESATVISAFLCCHFLVRFAACVAYGQRISSKQCIEKLLFLDSYAGNNPAPSGAFYDAKPNSVLPRNLQVYSQRGKRYRPETLKPAS